MCCGPSTPPPSRCHHQTPPRTSSSGGTRAAWCSTSTRRRPLMKVYEVMTPTVETVSPTDSLQEAAECMKTLDVGLLPVRDHDRLVGMITDRDITVRS